MAARLEARNITKVYPNGVRANDGISLAVAAGQVHAIIGENGAGKSTLMKIVYGMERPTAARSPSMARWCASARRRMPFSAASAWCIRTSC